MNRDDVIRMAREVVGDYSGDEYWPFFTEELERFAALVATAERRKYQADIEMWKAQAATAEKWRGLALGKDPMCAGQVVQQIQAEAAAAEREAILRIIDEIEEPFYTGYENPNTFDDGCIAVADAIRAREAK